MRRARDRRFGLKSIKQAGGIAIVQDPQEAVFPEMPMNAIQCVAVYYPGVGDRRVLCPIDGPTILMDGPMDLATFFLFSCAYHRDSRLTLPEKSS
ncbi:chemotaxis protein CheB [Methylocaldum szegediense]|uniref:chemotaxis protein CheB n=1 Tax=Methylocaldum szegediense TaxID=73780 RepID=UPI000A020E28